MNELKQKQLSLKNIHMHYWCYDYVYIHLVFTHTTQEVSLTIFFVPRPLTEAGKRSFRYRGTVLWKSLPTEVGKKAALNSFRAQCHSSF